MPGQPAVEDYDSPVYDEFWQTAIELDLPLSFHILTTKNERTRGPKISSFLSIVRGCQDIMAMLVFGGVFERHPDLKVVCVEADAGWVPHFMYRMDHAFNRHRYWLKPGAELHRLPSEYFADHIYVTFQDDWTAFKFADSMNWRVIHEYPATEAQIAARDYLEAAGQTVPDSLIKFPVPKVPERDTTATLTPVPANTPPLGFGPGAMSHEDSLAWQRTRARMTPVPGDSAMMHEMRNLYPNDPRFGPGGAGVQRDSLGRPINPYPPRNNVPPGMPVPGAGVMQPGVLPQDSSYTRERR